MSIELNLDTPNRKELAQLLRSIADLISVSKNKSILVIGKIHFQKEKEE